MKPDSDERSSGPTRRGAPAWLGLAALLALGCGARSIIVEPRQSVELPLRLRAGELQMIEIEATALGGEPATLGVALGENYLPPVRLESPPGQDDEQPAPIFGARLWSSFWEVPRAPALSLYNYGPGAARLDRIHLRRGAGEEVFERARDHVPFPPVGWVDLEELLEAVNRDGVGDGLAAVQAPSIAAWTTQNQRLAAFDRIGGLPLALRLARELSPQIELKASRLGSRGGVVGLSWRIPSAWRAISPGWIPPPEVARWIEIPADRPAPREFEARGSLHGLALYVGAAGGDPGAIRLRLFPIDSVTPAASSEWFDIDSAGRWIDLDLKDPLPAGRYVLELRSIAGRMMWLSWDRERMPGAGAGVAMDETLVVLESPRPAEAFGARDIRLQIVGSVDEIVRFGGPGAEGRPGNAQYLDYEIIIDVSLRPGETEIFHLVGYRP